MKLSPEQCDILLKNTQDAAIALLEDLEYLRTLASEWHHTSAELRRASAILRRLLIDGDLHKVASARIGRLHLKIPDYTALYRAESNAGDFLLFAAFEQMQIIRPKVMTRKMQSALELARNNGITKYTQVKIEGFKNQKVFCFEGKWVSRAEVITYVANNASGVHSSQSSDHIIPSIRRIFTYNRDENGDFNLFMAPPEDLIINNRAMNKPIEYDPKKIDPALAEILGSARLIIESEDILRLEDTLRSEFGISFEPR